MRKSVHGYCALLLFISLFIPSLRTVGVVVPIRYMKNAPKSQSDCRDILLDLRIKTSRITHYITS